MSADGMAVLAPVAGKAKERVRIHAQLGDFPLLTDARVVRMTKHRDGYRWALHFEQLDERMRANLEAFVRQQLASAARIRQAQLYAERLKGGGLPLPPHATPIPGSHLPTPGPHALAPIHSPASSLDSDPSQPLSEAGLPYLSPGASPITPSETPAHQPEPHVLEIELPDLGIAAGPSLDLDSQSSASGVDPVYVPYQVTDVADEAALLGEGPLTPAPADNPPAISRTEIALEPPTPRHAAPAPAPAVAKTLTPGVIEIDDDEDLSLEDILAEVGGDEPVQQEPLASDLGLPPPRELAADTSGFGDVPVVDEQLGDDEETRRRPTIVPTDDSDEVREDDAPALASVFAKGGTLISGDGTPELLPSGEVDRTVALEGAPDDVGVPSPAGRQTLLAGSGFSMASAASEPPAADDSGEISLDAVEAAQPEPVASKPPASPPATPALAFDEAPAFDELPSLDGLSDEDEEDSEDGIPSLDSAILRNTAPTPPPGTLGPSFPAHPSPFFDAPEGDEEPEPHIPEPFAAVPSSVPTPAPGELDPQPPAFIDEGPVAPVARTPAPSTPAPSLYSDDAQPFDPYEPNASPPAGAAPVRLGSAPRALGELPPPVSGLYTPASNPSIREESGAYATASFEPFAAEEGLYGDRSDVTFEEQQGNPRQRLAFLQQDDRSTHSLAAQHDLFLGDIEGVTSGLTPTAYKRGMTDEDLGASEPEPEQAPPDESSFRDAGVPEPAEAEPTRPVDVGPAEFTPPPQEIRSAEPDTSHPPEPEELTMEDVEFDEYYDDYEELDPEPVSAPAKREPAEDSAVQRGFATYPEFNVIPDYDQPLDQNVPRRSGPEPAQSGRTIVSTLEDLMARPPMAEPSGPIVRTDPTIPGDFAPVASFEGPQAPLAGFTVVAQLDDFLGGPGTLSGSTMIASADDVEAWKQAALAGNTASPVSSKGLDEQRTSSYTPPPGSLDDLAGFGPTSISEHALTAMRVGRGGLPSGAGFELNPRGPAPQQVASASEAPAATLGRMPLVKMRVDATVPSATVPAPSRTGATIPAPSARAEPLPSARPTLPPGNPSQPATAKPGPSPRRSTTLDSGGRPAPPPKPTSQRAEPVQAKSEAPEASAPPTRRSLVEDALAQLKRKTDAKRAGKERDTETKTTAEPTQPAKPAKRPKRKKSLGAAEVNDPAIAELYRAAMSDLERSRD